MSGADPGAARPRVGIFVLNYTLWSSPSLLNAAHLLAEAGRREEAVRAYHRGISLTTDVAARRYLGRCAR